MGRIVAVVKHYDADEDGPEETWVSVPELNVHSLSVEQAQALHRSLGEALASLAENTTE